MNDPSSPGSWSMVKRHGVVLLLILAPACSGNDLPTAPTPTPMLPAPTPTPPSSPPPITSIFHLMGTATDDDGGACNRCHGHRRAEWLPKRPFRLTRDRRERLQHRFRRAPCRRPTCSPRLPDRREPGTRSVCELDRCSCHWRLQRLARSSPVPNQANHRGRIDVGDGCAGRHIVQRRRLLLVPNRPCRGADRRSADHGRRADPIRCEYRPCAC